MTEVRKRLHEFPQGFLGWAGNVQQPVPLKMYASCISVEYTKEQYEKYAQSIVLEILKLEPKRSDETLKDVFFKVSRPFLHHFNHEEFIVEAVPIDFTLADLLNFPPMDDDSMTEERKTKQMVFLNEFVGSYKGFQAGKVMIKEDQGMGNLEMVDKCHFIRLGLAHSAPDTVIYEEVGIKGPSDHCLPHGYIDLLSYTQSSKDSALLLHCIVDGLKSVLGKCSQITPTTVKSPNTYCNPGSDRQAIVELLSLSQVLLQNNPNMECLIMLKVSRDLYCPYFYFPRYDTLLRASANICLSPRTTKEQASHQSNYKLIGSFILSLIMHHLYNLRLLAHLDTIKCGWADSYAASKMKYNAYIYPKYSEKASVAVKTQQDIPASKKFRANEYSDFEYDYV